MKRIAIFADGTWNAPDRGGSSNVLRMARAVAPRHRRARQVVFYDWGVGTDRKELLGGISGAGIDKNITDCYRFLVHNYDEGDKLYFFGFSRGAYTVRSLGGLVRNCGLLRREHAGRIVDAYKLYRLRSRASSPDEDRATDFRARYAVADITPIEFIGVWDTVGALGIPVPFWGTLGARDFLFHDTEPSRIIAHARHAMAIDEQREDFLPTLWDDKAGLDLLQVWFSGAHSDVGGGYEETGLAHLAMRWMLGEAESFGLGFEDHLPASLAPDAADRLHDSRRGIYRARGRVVREVGGPVHASVHARWQADVDGYRGKSRALQQMLAKVEGDWSRVELVGR